MIQGGLPRLLGGLHVDLAGDHRGSVFVAGSGRSGTTWLAEAIARGRGYRLVFEPFHSGKVGACRDFRSKQYLRPDDRREAFLGPAREVLSGRVRGRWTDRLNRAFVARRRVIKDIRTNLLLGWMRANFPGMPMVLLLRHPCAVVASRLALGWKDNLSETMEQPALVEDFLYPMEREIRAARGAFERHVFLWCIDNFVPLRQFAPSGIHLVFYEDLIVRPEVELRRLSAVLGEDLDVPGVRRALRRPSPLSRKPEGPGPAPLDGWRGSVTERELGRALEILGLFGLDRLYGENPMPDPSGVHSLMNAGVRG